MEAMETDSPSDRDRDPGHGSSRRAGPSRSIRWLSILLFSVGLGGQALSSADPQSPAQRRVAVASGTEPAASVPGRPELDAPPPTQRVVRRMLRANPRQEYFLYVPSSGGARAPLFVTVHGISRNAQEHATLFSRHAEAYGVVLVAPYFAEGQHGDYQRLGRAGRGGRADATLDSIIVEVASLTGASTQKIYLFGFSGGAQFAHRYTMAHPRQVARAAVAAAGWYTY